MNQYENNQYIFKKLNILNIQLSNSNPRNYINVIILQYLILLRRVVIL